MSEFEVEYNSLKTQASRIEDVADMLTTCKSSVESVNHGLGLIGIAGVSGSLDSIISRLARHNGVCNSFSSSLQRIAFRYATAEANIMGVPVTSIWEGDIPSVDGPGGSGNDSPYVGVIYLLDSNGAAGQGHAAVLLVHEDGSVEYYSYGSDGPNLAIDVLVDHPLGDQFFESGILDTDITHNGLFGTQFDTYTDYIYMPINNEQGMNMHNAAMEILDHPQDYNLLENNCNMNAQQILAAGGGNFNFGPEGFDMLGTKPNQVYENWIAYAQANPDLCQGYVFGSVPNGDLGFASGNQVDLSYFTQQSGGYPVFYGENYYSGNFSQPYMGQLVDLVLTPYQDYLYTQYGTHTNEVFLDMLYNGGLGDSFGDYIASTGQSTGQFWVNTGYDVVQLTGNCMVDGIQSVSTSGIDALQQYIPFDGVNSAIDTAQYYGNEFIDWGQETATAIGDGLQDIGNTLYEEGSAFLDDPLGYIFG